MPRTPAEDEPQGGAEDLAHWLLRVETGGGLPHDIVAFGASLVIVVRALPTAAARIASAWTRRRG